MTASASDRQSKSMALAEELLDDLELSRLTPHQLLLKSSRLARLTRDHDAEEWLGYELTGYTFTDSTKHLIDWSGRWADNEHERAYTFALSEASGRVAAEKARLASLQGITFGANTAFATMTNHQAMINNASSLISSMTAIEGKVVGALHTWVTRTFHELLFSDLQADLFSAAQTEIDARLIPLTDTTLAKIETISDRLRAGDPESVSNAMSTVRRLITAAADAVFPARDEPYVLGGQEMRVNSNAVLNRLKAYAADTKASKGRRDRLSRTVHDIWGRASAGDHSDIDVTEARYIFLQTYVVLGELLTLRD